MPTRVMYFPATVAVSVPAMPHNPSIPTMSLPAWNGACAILKASEAQKQSSAPNAKAARTEYSRRSGYCLRSVKSERISAP